MQSEILTKYALDISNIEKNFDKIKKVKLEKYDLRFTHLLCMVKIRQNRDGLTSTEISQTCAIDKAFVSRITADLINRDLIKINEKFNDGRKYKHKYILTDKGNLIMDDIINDLSVAVNTISSKIPREDLRIFFRVLTAFNDNIDSAVDEILNTSL